MLLTWGVDGNGWTGFRGHARKCMWIWAATSASRSGSYLSLPNIPMRRLSQSTVTPDPAHGFIHSPRKQMNIFFLNPERYDRRFGRLGERREGTCAFGFEANPKHVLRLKEIERSYNEQKWATKFHHNVVWVTDGEMMPIYTDDMNIYEDWAAGILPHGLPDQDQMTVYNVPTIDIARWLEEALELYRPSVVMVKMDIEGSEFSVLPLLLRRGLLCSDKIQAIVLEYHEWAKGDHALTMPHFRKQLDAQECLPTLIIDFDDESYMLDGKELPS